MNSLSKLCLVGLLASGCTSSVHQVAMGNFDDIPPSARMRPVEAEAKQRVFVATTNTDFTDEAMARLAASCPNGRVVGIQARHSTNHGFFVYKNRLRPTGYCVEIPDAAREPERAKAP